MDNPLTSLSGRLRSAPWVLGIIVLQLLLRSAIYPLFYRSINFFHGDSAFYIWLSRHLLNASADRPSGYSFFIRVVTELTGDHTPTALLVSNTSLAVATHILLFLTLRHMLKVNGLAFVLSILVFGNPLMVVHDTMVFMTDTMALFLLSLSLFLLFCATPAGRSMAAAYNAAIGLLLGYLVIVRFGYLWLVLLLIVVRFAGLLKSLIVQPSGTQPSRRQPTQIAAVGLAALVVSFSIIPSYYAMAFNRTRLGVASLENISGRTMLAKLLPLLSCREVIALGKDAEERKLIGEVCSDGDLDIHPDLMLWIEASFQNRLVPQLVSNTTGRWIHPRVLENDVMQRLALQAIRQRPTLVLQAIWDPLRHYLCKPQARWTMVNLPPKRGGVEMFELFNIDLEHYQQEWERHVAEHARGTARVFELSRLFMRWTYPVFFMTLIAAPLWCVVRRQHPSEQLLVLWLMAGCYLAMATIPLTYYPRYYYPFNYMAALLLATMLSEHIPQLRSKGNQGSHASTVGR